RHGAEGRAARPLRARGGARPGAARHPLQRAAALGRRREQRGGRGPGREGRGGRGKPRIDAMTLRLGRIGYVNMAPVFYRLEYDVEEVVGVPTELNRMLLDG